MDGVEERVVHDYCVLLSCDRGDADSRRSRRSRRAMYRINSSQKRCRRPLSPDRPECRPAAPALRRLGWHQRRRMCPASLPRTPPASPLSPVRQRSRCRPLIHECAVASWPRTAGHSQKGHCHTIAIEPGLFPTATGDPAIGVSSPVLSSANSETLAEPLLTT